MADAVTDKVEERPTTEPIWLWKCANDKCPSKPVILPPGEPPPRECREGYGNKYCGSDTFRKTGIGTKVTKGSDVKILDEKGREMGAVVIPVGTDWHRSSIHDLLSCPCWKCRGYWDW